MTSIAPPRIPPAVVRFGHIRTKADFDRCFPDESACRDYLIAWRWPDGFECPRCQSRRATWLPRRALFLCLDCERQTSATAGTVLQARKLPLRSIFWGLFRLATSKKSVSALELQKELGIGAYRSSWYLLMRLRHVLQEHETQALEGDVEVDEAFIAPKGKGIPADAKPMVVVAVATDPEGPRYRRWRGVRIQPCEKRTKSALHAFVKREVRPGSRLVVDGLSSYRSLREEGYDVMVIDQRGLKAAELRELDPLPHAHLAIKHLKTLIAGTFHGVTARYLLWYTRAFVYRVNRRDHIRETFGRICRRLVTSVPLTLRGLRGMMA